MKPTQAPVSMTPSMAMLITPDRSHRMPASAPSVIGVARRTMRASISTMSIRLPAPAQIRMMKIAEKINMPM